MLRGAILCSAAVGVLAAAACSTSSTSSTSPSTSPPVTSASSGSPATQGGLPLETTPTGTAVLSWDPATTLVTAAIDMQGFTPSSSHAMHIHPGTCADQTQPPAVPFPDITADAAGAIRQSVVSGPVPGGIPGGSYLNIHLAPSAQLGASTDVSFTPIGCADIPADTPKAGPVTLKVAAPQKNGETPAGTVKLTYDGTQHSLQVVLHATGLPAGSAHAVHIHTGSCAAQGAVLYPLPDLQADGAGDGSLTATVDNVATPPPATGWYVNVHMGPMSQILDGNTPTLLFAPILCANVTG